MKTILRTGIVILSLLVSFNVFSLTLKEAKHQGLVGEQPNGYLGAVKSSPDVSKLVADINQKRKAAYNGIAKRNDTNIGAVQALAGEKAVAKTPKGQFIKSSNGWSRVQ